MSVPGQPTLVLPASQNATLTGFFSAFEFKPGDVIAARYKYIKLLGAGAMGLVFKAHDLQLEIDVALKLLRPELAAKPEAFDRFRQELLLARQVSSPYVIRIHDLIQHQNAWLISMDLVDGESLEELLRREKKLSIERTIQIVCQLAEGLQAAHFRGVVHRDLKPANVLIRKNGNALISDFGVARSIGATGLTASGMVVGTPAYLSPEQAQAAPIDGRSDLYTLGLMIYEMLTGHIPFSNGTPSEMLVQRILQAPASVNSIRTDTPLWLSAITDRLLSPDPNDRIATGSDLIRAIETQTAPVRKTKTQNRWWPKSIIAAGALILGSVGVWQYQKSATPAAILAPAIELQDLVILPVTLESDQAQDLALAKEFRRDIEQNLFAQKLKLISNAQMDRALIGLQFDELSARRNLKQVENALPTKRILDIKLTRNKNELIADIALFSRGQALPEWRQSAAIKNSPEWRTLTKELARRLKIDPLFLSQIDLSTLQLMAAVQDVTPIFSAEKLGQFNLEQQAMIGFEALVRAEKNPEWAAPNTIARQLLDLFPHDNQSAAILKTRAYAQLILAQIEVADQTLKNAVLSQIDPSLQMLRVRVLEAKDDLTAAATLLEEMTRADPSNVEAWIALGKNAIKQGNHNRALNEHLMRADIAARNFQRPDLRAEIANAFGVGYRRNSQPEYAIESFNQAINFHRQNKNHRGEANSLLNLAVLLSTQGKFDQAGAAFQRARELLQPLGDQEALANLANDLGVMEEERGNYNAALRAYSEALTLRKNVGNPDQSLIGESLLNIGYAYYQLGDFNNADVYWQQANEHYAKLDEISGQISAQQNLGLVYTMRGEFDKARAAYQTSLQRAEANQANEERAVSLMGLAEQEFLEGRINLALKNIEAAEPFFKTREDARGLQEVALLRMEIFTSIGQWDEAIKSMRAANLDQASNLEQRASFLVLQSEISQAKNQWTQAKELALDGLNLALESHSLRVELRARLALALALFGNREEVQARAELRKTRTLSSQFSSVPLQLRLIEAALIIEPKNVDANYRAARILLANLPSYGRSFRIHWLASLHFKKNTATWNEAKKLASEDFQTMMQQLDESYLTEMHESWPELMAPKTPETVQSP